MALVHEGVDREQLHRSDAELLQMLDHRRGGEAGVGAAKLLRDLGMALREALDMDFVDRACPARACAAGGPRPS